MGEERRDLERADEAETRNIGGLHCSDIASFKGDSPGGRRDEFRQHIKAGGLARTVWAYQGVERAGPYAQGDVTNPAKFAEAFAGGLRAGKMRRNQPPPPPNRHP